MNATFPPGVAPWLVWALLGMVLAALAFALRIAVHVGYMPGGVDSWYLMSYARSLRRERRLAAELPQYLLQDRHQSYPPLFPALLALVPTRLLERWFWVLSPAIDCAHLLLLYWLSFRITGSLAVAAITGAIYAFTPHLVSETRSLSARSFSALVHSLAMLLTLKALLLGPVWPWSAAALACGAAVFLSSATAAASYGLACAVLAVVFRQPAYVAFAVASFGLAWLASGGHLRNVILNYWHAVAFWMRNRGRYGAHPIADSPLYGDPTRRAAKRPGLFGRNTALQLLRVFGENPFVLALPLAPAMAPLWGHGLYWWAVAVSALTILATLLPPLRVFGAGRSYIKLAVFPTAYTLALGIGNTSNVTAPYGLLVLGCLAAGACGIAFFVVYTRGRATERTESTPEGLAKATQHLAGLPDGGVFCLPFMYADYVGYNAGKNILWGAHCGDLHRVQAILPVISRALPELFEEYGVRYVLLDHLYTSPATLGLTHGLRTAGRWDSFELFEVDERALRMVAS